MADYLSAELLAQTIGVYRYDKTKPDGIGEKLTSGYEITYDPDSYLITFSLPDATPLIVVYEYTIDHSQSSQSVTIRNTATLNGTAYETSVEDVVFDHVDSSASVNKATMTIYKVDSDTLETLPGAQFKMERYEDPEGDGNYAWTTSSLTATGADGIFEVGEEGLIKLDFLEHEDGRGSLYDTLYRMWEIKAPSGYEKSNDYFYFVWLKDGQSKEQAIAAMAPQGIFGTEEGQVNPDQVEFIAFSTNSSHYVPNTAKELSVQKEWKDFQGNDLETDLPTSVEVTLYQYAKDNRENAQPYGTSVTLNADNEWSHTWKALPTENDQGIEVYYYVQETSNPEGYVVTYSENNGEASTINEGTTTITNKKESTYLLPETGGVGPVLWSICGSAFLIVSAGLGISVIKKKKGGKNRRNL